MLTAQDLVARGLREDRQAEAEQAALIVAARAASREARAARRLAKIKHDNRIAQAQMSGMDV
jgi:hypothetical protein